MMDGVELRKVNKIGDNRGNLFVAEYLKEIPFVVKRIYYIRDVSDIEIKRGLHSHKQLHQCFICMNGACTIIFDDGNGRETYLLDDPGNLLYIKPGIWREMQFSSKDTVLLVLASDVYSESDYIRNYNEFINDKKVKQ